MPPRAADTGPPFRRVGARSLPQRPGPFPAGNSPYPTCNVNTAVARPAWPFVPVPHGAGCRGECPGNLLHAAAQPRVNSAATPLPDFSLLPVTLGALAWDPCEPGATGSLFGSLAGRSQEGARARESVACCGPTAREFGCNPASGFLSPAWHPPFARPGPVRFGTHRAAPVRTPVFCAQHQPQLQGGMRVRAFGASGCPTPREFRPPQASQLPTCSLPPDTPGTPAPAPREPAASAAFVRYPCIRAQHQPKFPKTAAAPVASDTPCSRLPYARFP